VGITVARLSMNSCLDNPAYGQSRQFVKSEPARDCTTKAPVCCNPFIATLKIVGTRAHGHNGEVMLQ